MPKVSIIMPYYNSSQYIKETIGVIVSQTYKDWELIIVDDYSSTPEDEDILKWVEALDARIKVMRAEKNRGAGVTRNIGIKAAVGKYLAFCDSDDWWYPTKLEEQLKWMEENDFPFTCTWYEDTNEKLEPYYIMKQKPKNSYQTLKSGCNIGTPGVMINLEKLGKKYMPNLRRAEDWGLWMLFLRDTEYIYTYPKVLWKYRHVPGSETSNKFKLMKNVTTMYREVLGMNPVWAWIYCSCVFLPKNILKKLKKKL